MRRIPITICALLAVGAVALGCSSGSTTSTSSPNTTAAGAGTTVATRPSWPGTRASAAR